MPDLACAMCGATFDDIMRLEKHAHAAHEARLRDTTHARR